ncbi:family 43 glycosylhydrolase [Streptomyces sp. NPDC050523]|uniref:family 43 glycosylhydrolase n=1 Tax=Streptomyces sp. NPDC050523 TaxID=3365622 RepID=UPI00378A09A3
MTIKLFGPRWRRRVLGVLLAVAWVVALALVGTDAWRSDGGAAGQDGPDDPAADESQDFPFAGADTIALHDGSNRYVTYGASIKHRKVPYSVHGSSRAVGTSPKIDGDALPDGPGAWASHAKGIWTPGAFYHSTRGVGRYYLFYTALKRDTSEQYCVGVASSPNPFSGFVADLEPLLCPSDTGQWVMDADVTADPKDEDEVWMTWRDGRKDEEAESTLSAAKLSFRADGSVGLASPSHTTVLLRGDKLDWARYPDTTGPAVIGNPSLLYHAGNWYLFYSGNRWTTGYNAIGIAFCGAKLDDGECSPLPGPQQAWFSYSGPKPHLPSQMRKHDLPGNKRGPGAMDVYRAHDGQPWVTWKYLSNTKGRKSRTGKLIITGTGSAADFSVTLPESSAP